MAVEIKLPDLGEGIDSGDILDILVSEGETISKDQNIVEIETDKATVEVPSSHAGKVLRIHVSNGDSVGTGQILITVETPVASPVVDSPPPKEDKPTSPVETRSPETAPSVDPPKANLARAPAVSNPVPSAERKAPEPSARGAKVPPTMTVPHGPIPAGPAIRRLAREVGVDLVEVVGTGENGRISREDVLLVVRNANQTSAESSGASSALSAVTPPHGAELPKLPGTPGSDKWGPISIEKASKIRRIIATKMSESWSTVPRVTNFDDADVTELERIRQTSKADYAAKGIKLTSMPFIIKSVSMALRQNPAINASLDLENDQVLYKNYVNVGIAVDTERGLLVPALRQTDQKGISEIARELSATADRVRSNNFGLDDLRGGTFTISNLGAIGGTYSTPIINVPESAILLVGRSRDMPVVVDDEIEIRLMMPLSPS